VRLVPKIDLFLNTQQNNCILLDNRWILQQQNKWKKRVIISMKPTRSIAAAADVVMLG
jgi:hypothetical protein